MFRIIYVVKYSFVTRNKRAQISFLDPFYTRSDCGVSQNLSKRFVIRVQILNRVLSCSIRLIVNRKFFTFKSAGRNRYGVPFYGDELDSTRILIHFSHVAEHKAALSRCKKIFDESINYSVALAA